MTTRVTHDPVEPDELPTSPEVDELEDFDAFWNTRKRRAKSVTIMGDRVSLPPSLPLRFEMEAKRLERSESNDDVKHLLAILLGDDEDLIARWAERGMDLEQFQVLLAWLPQVIAGHKVTLSEVADAVAKANERTGSQGKARTRRS